jgi:hypothetical protein
MADCSSQPLRFLGASVQGPFGDARRGESAGRSRRIGQDDDTEVLMIWLLVLILAILAIGGGVALSKFLFLLLVVALVVALVGAFNRTTV